MACEWVRLASQATGKRVFVNLANAVSVEDHKKGSRIRFISGNGYVDIDVDQRPEEILGPIGEIQHSDGA